MKKHENKFCKSGSIKINSEEQRRVGTDWVVTGSKNNSDRNRNLTLTFQKLVIQTCNEVMNRKKKHHRVNTKV
jgi:hypothetical protein